MRAQQRLVHLVARSPAVIYSFKAKGYEPQEYLVSPDFWQSRVHPKDIDRVLSAMGRLFEEGHLTNEYRFRKKDGNYCWIGDELQLVRNESGDPIEVIGAWSDITARRHLGEALVAAQNRLVQRGRSAYACNMFWRRESRSPAWLIPARWLGTLHI